MSAPKRLNIIKDDADITKGLMKVSDKYNDRNYISYIQGKEIDEFV